MRSWTTAALQGAAVALGYLVAGKASLLLAIPPGYASAIWPSAGIALGALLLLGLRYWPAVWLGSFLTNLAISFDPHSGASVLGMLLPAASIGAGAAMQAVVGAALIRRYIGLPLLLSREWQILLFFVLAGPLACLINPTVGVSTLWFGGAIPTQSLAYHWWTWWIGDSIGAILFAPLMLMWFGGQQWHQRRLAVTVPLAATFVATVLVFVYASRLEWAQIEQRFKEDAEELNLAIDRRLDRNLELLRALGGLFAASERVDEVEFGRFSQFMLANRPDLQAIEWAPRVRSTQRAAFERELQQVQAQQPYIFEVDASGPHPAQLRQEHYPVRYAEPMRANRIARGFDLASEPERLRTLERARDSGKIAMTAPLELLQAGGAYDGFIMAQPIYSAQLPSEPTLEQRREHFLGFALAVIRARQLISLAVKGRPPAHNVHIHLDDALTGKTLYRSTTDIDAPTTAGGANRLPLGHQVTLQVADRDWTIVFRPTLEYLAGQNTLIAWMVLVAGLLFTALVGAAAMVVTGRTAAVEAQVRERTAELAESYRRLAEAGRVKSEFISTVSHELRTPLTSIRGSLGLLSSGAAGQLPDKAVPLVDIAHRNTARLGLLIDDILDIEKIDSGKLSLKLQIHSLPELVEQSVEANRGYAQNCNVEFSLLRPLSEARVRVDANRLLQVMANLLSNAAKFSLEGAAVQIAVTNDGHRARVIVRDCGPGIPADFQSHVFERFSQADSSDSRIKGGTGLGLAISRALIERMQGTIGFETAEGKGTTFFIELPLVRAETSV